MIAFSILDKKAEGANTPFFSQTRATAMRELAMKLRENPMMATYAEDFILYQVGTWDPHKPELSGQLPERVCDVMDLLEETDGTDKSPRISEK